jgi:ubiquinone/menaquinone biosynthesis C-methylase UbiE
MDHQQDAASFKAFGKTVDFGRTASDYRTFRAGFPERFFARIARQFDLRSGMRALDIGTGTGTVARGLALRALDVAAVDPSAPLMGEAAELDDEAQVQVAYSEGRAENLPFEADTFDILTAGQCWHWFDRAAASSEAMRVLKPGGALIIAHFDWLPLPGSMVAATEAMILQANPKWLPMAGGMGIHPQWLGDLAVAGFEQLKTASFDIDQMYSHDAWCGRIRASAGIKATLDDADAAHFSQKLLAMLRADFPADPIAVPHRVWWASGRKPSA